MFVDVWQREITAIEAPELLDVALGGVDTATRLQTIWQVRALQNVGPHDCGDVIPAWTDEIAPPAARLTTSAQPSVDTGDDCDVPSAGGFRGRENRLYRVEVHTGGTVGGGGAATFKWSRDNASVASNVDAIAGGTAVTVRRLGRDEVLRFRVDDWVEVLDDRVEFRRQSGHMARITRIDEAARTLTIAPAIPAGFAFDPTDPTRHTRVRRWDQRSGVDPATGLLTATAGAIALEDGIEITFTTDPAGGGLRAGEYWVFAARTADGSVESLQAAPPRGPVHHFCRLALITWAGTVADTDVQDCRVIWPPRAESCCTKVVFPGEDIQAAIDSLPDAGGCVCLKVGVHPIDRPLLIRRSHVTVHGETTGAVIRRAGGGQVFAIGRVPPEPAITSVRIESLTLLGLEADISFVEVVNVEGLEIAYCEMQGVAKRGMMGAGINVLLSSEVVISANRIRDAVFGVNAEGSGLVVVAGNQLIGPVFGPPGQEVAGGHTAVLFGPKTTAPCVVARNHTRDFDRGIVALHEVRCVLVENEYPPRAAGGRAANRQAGVGD